MPDGEGIKEGIEHRKLVVSRSTPFCLTVRTRGKLNERDANHYVLQYAGDR
jgi:hypothetical protein